MGVLALVFSMGSVHAQPIPAIGNVTAVQQEANVMRGGELNVDLVKLGDSVLFKDTYETKAKSKVKLLFEDDSLLSLGENTKIQITENIYDPDRNRRSTVMNLLEGTVRALVGRLFTGEGSRFEIHTRTAVAAARGTYFIVWTPEEDEDQTGVVNIGREGRVAVSNMDSSIEGFVELGPNEYTMIGKGQLPTPPAGIGADLLGELLLATEVKDQVADEVPGGTEAPGADVSGEMLTPLPVVSGPGGGSAWEY